MITAGPRPHRHARAWARLAALLVVPLVVVGATGDARSGDDVLLIGDSWGGAGGSWNGVFAANGHPEITLINAPVAGSTAADWAGQPDLLPNLLLANPDVRWVIVTLSGNDLMQAWGDGTKGTWMTRARQDLQAIFRPAIDVRPSIRIVLPGYDFFNFEQSAFCLTMASQTFPGLLTPQINAELMTTSDVQAQVASDFSNVSSVAAWGSLQAAGGIHPAPNVLLPSPVQYLFDCIHPNASGYDVFDQAVYDAYFDAQLDPPCSTDADGDGFVAAACGGVDCDDTDPFVHPAATETTGNGLDDDCDATTPDAVGCGAVTGPAAGAPVPLLGGLLALALARNGQRRRRA